MDELRHSNDDPSCAFQAVVSMTTKAFMSGCHRPWSWTRIGTTTALTRAASSASISPSAPPAPPPIHSMASRKVIRHPSCFSVGS